MTFRASAASLAILSFLGAAAPGFPAQAAQSKPPVQKVVPPDEVASLSPRQAIDRANAYFNAAATMIADFVQLGADGQRLEGKLYVQRPGRMRFEYDPPAPLEIVADGTSVAVKDVKLAKQDLYFIGQTPLKFLLQDHIDLERDTKVLDVSSNARTTAIVIEDSATFGGTSRITLTFDTPKFQLQQWTVTDPQGYETNVSLYNVDLTHRPNPALFKIDEYANTRK